MTRLRDAVMANAAAAEALRGELTALNDDSDQQMTDLTIAADDEYESVSTLMIAVAVVGIVLGLGIGGVVGQFGVAKPMRTLVGILQRLANGESVDISGTERRDEIGETARAVNGIKDMLAEKASREALDKEERDRAAMARARRTCTRWPTSSKARLAASSRPCPRQPPSWKRRPER